MAAASASCASSTTSAGNAWSLSGERVVRELDAIAEWRGYPLMVVSDNGTELTSNAMLEWQQDRGVEWHYIGTERRIRRLVDELNARQMRGFGSSCAELFAEDKPKRRSWANCRTSVRLRRGLRLPTSKRGSDFRSDANVREPSKAPPDDGISGWWV